GRGGQGLLSRISWIDRVGIRRSWRERDEFLRPPPACSFGPLTASGRRPDGPAVVPPGTAAAGSVGRSDQGILRPAGCPGQDVRAGDDGVHAEAAGPDENAGGPGSALGPIVRDLIPTGRICFEFPVALAALAPLLEELSGLGVDRQPVLEQERQVEQSVLIRRDAPDLAGPALGLIPGRLEAAQVRPFGGEPLDAGVVQVGDEDLVLLVDGDADRREELARPVALLAPGEDEPGPLRGIRTQAAGGEE